MNTRFTPGRLAPAVLLLCAAWLSPSAMAQADEARANPAQLSSAAQAKSGGYFADWVMETAPSFLTTETMEDVVIRTTLDTEMQKRAEEALRHAGLWEGLQGKLVLGENVSQAAQFATSGNAQGGIIAYSLALAPNLAGRGEWALIPQDWHQPLRQRMVLLNKANATSEAFYRYLQEPAARAIMADYGFTLPAAE